MAKLVQCYRTLRGPELEKRLLSFTCLDCGEQFDFGEDGITAAEANARGHMMTPEPQPKQADWYRWRCAACAARK